jgi:hypothetical protein
MDKITDWAEVISDRICEEVYCVLGGPATGYDATANALELVLSQSCAGPESIRRAMIKLALISE